MRRRPVELWSPPTGPAGFSAHKRQYKVMFGNNGPSATQSRRIHSFSITSNNQPKYLLAVITWKPAPGFRPPIPSIFQAPSSCYPSNLSTPRPSSPAAKRSSSVKHHSPNASARWSFTRRARSKKSSGPSRSGPSSFSARKGRGEGTAIVAQSRGVPSWPITSVRMKRNYIFGQIII